MSFFVFVFLLTHGVEPPTVDARELCVAASRSFKDMRKFQGRVLPQAVPDRLDGCTKLVQLGVDDGYDVRFLARVAAVGYNECNYRTDCVGSKGEMGMMQILPNKCEFALEDGHCNHELAGIRYLKKRYTDATLPKSKKCRSARTKEGKRFTTWQRALGAYNGRCGYGEKVEGYARSVLKNWWAVRR